jgi:hypothetical protein
MILRPSWVLIRASCVQGRDSSYASASVAAQLAAAPLLGRLDLASTQLQSVRGALAPRADVASGAVSARLAGVGFAVLPASVIGDILSFLPADQCARCALVCRAWRGVVADPTVWRILDLGVDSGVLQPLTDAKLLAATRMARGQLNSLYLDYCKQISTAALLEVVRANPLLDDLRIPLTGVERAYTPDIVRAILEAAPKLTVLNVSVKTADVADATRMLRHEPPFAALCLDELHVCRNAEDDQPDTATMLAFCSALAVYPKVWLTVLTMERLGLQLSTPAVADALSAAVIACRLPFMGLKGCDLSPASVPALVRLIRECDERTWATGYPERKRSAAGCSLRSAAGGCSSGEPHAG